MKPDVIWRTIELVIQYCPDFPTEAARIVEMQARAEFGGERLWIAKQPFHPKRRNGPAPLPEEKVREVIRDAIAEPTLTTDQLTKRHGVSRATLYRLLKRGP